MIYVSGPGHGGPAVVANTYLEGTYSEVYPDISQDEAGLQQLFTQFSFPGGIPSHASPETPGLDPRRRRAGLLAAATRSARCSTTRTCSSPAWSATARPRPARWPRPGIRTSSSIPVADGAVLPILHLNGYKIANPTVLARIPREELEQLLRGYGWDAASSSKATSPRRCTTRWPRALDACDRAHPRDPARRARPGRHRRGRAGR